MTDNAQSFTAGNASLKENEFEGVYGPYSITRTDELEVQRYRLALLLCGLTFSAGLGQWLIIGPSWAWIWLLPMSIGLGLALHWIHIYLRPLHQALQLLWALGCLGAVLIALIVGTDTMLSTINAEPVWTLAIGPLFAALTGVGFKEFFCFGRPEAIGLTLLIPIALLGHLSGLMGGEVVMALLASAALLLLVLALRKFGMDAAADVGDKSVFTYLSNQQANQAL